MGKMVLPALITCALGLINFISSNGQAEIISVSQFNCGISSVSDIQNNSYQTFLSDKKCWMAENLKVTKYRTGELINSGYLPKEPRIGHYFSYNNDLNNSTAYGLLYNLAAIDDTRGLCPAGWRVPSKEDWQSLMATLGVVDGGELRQLPTGFPQTFAGMIDKDGSFSGLGRLGFWWSSSKVFESSKADAGDRGLSEGYKLKVGNIGYVVERNVFPWNTNNLYTSLSVRCVVSLSSPAVTTYPVTDVASTSVRTGGAVTSPWSPVLQKGMVYGTVPDPNVESGTVLTDLTTVGPGSFGANLTGLIGGKEYFVRAFASNGVGIGYGPTVVFTTPPGLPAVITSSVTSDPEYGGWRANSGGFVTSDHGKPVTDRGVAYGTSPNPTIEGPHTKSGSGLGEFTSTLMGLTPSTIYYARAYATNEKGTGYGSLIAFTSSSTVPSLTNLTFVKETETAVRFSFTLTVPYEMRITKVGLVYGQSSEPTIAGSKFSINLSPGSYPQGQTIEGEISYAGMSGLAPGGRYWVRPFATNGEDVIYGEAFQRSKKR
jgi:uncharacterized protein (TIGR02145 family)